MKKICLLPLLLLVFIACEDPFMNQTYVQKTGDDLELTNASYLQKNEGTFSLWIELLKYADMYNALNDASTTSTVFAPDNDAMKAFLAWKGVSSVTELSKSYARSVVQVNILNYDMEESSFINYVEAGSIPIKTLFGSYLSASYGYINKDVDDVDLPDSKLQDSLSIYLNNQAKVKALARATSNGEVYTMSGVIHPLAETILDVLKNYKNYTIFVDAIEKTGFDQTIAVCSDTVYNLDGSYSVNDVRFTCFAVPDEVYKKAGISTLDGLVSSLGAGNNYTDTTNALNQYVKYHFMNKNYTKSELFSFQEAGQINLLDTELPGEVMAFQSVGGADMINNCATIIRSNITARNGLIHKVDNVMPIYEPTPVKVRWDFCNYPDIISFINAYGAAKNLGELFYTPLSVKEYPLDLSLDQRDGNFGTISSFAYVANSTKSSYSTWRKVGYFKCCYISSTEKTTNKYGAYMDNLMTVNLGYAGWIQFKTPTIVKGKYKVVFYYAGTASLNSYYTGGSLTKFSLDDQQKSIYVWKGLPGKFIETAKQSNKLASGLAADVLWNEVDFDKSESHTFKITMMDINAKTSSSYRQMWDYVEFIPISEN
ncbi:MAG: DUF5108 domain-containing protein [Bacteroidota bacterium]|nr:DUF5108 domain-containing protein [Bacteroidota bacterium]